MLNPPSVLWRQAERVWVGIGGTGGALLESNSLTPEISDSFFLFPCWEVKNIRKRSLLYVADVILGSRGVCWWGGGVCPGAHRDRKRKKGLQSVFTICLQGYAHLHVSVFGSAATFCEGSACCLQLMSLLWKCGQALAGGGYEWSHVVCWRWFVQDASVPEGIEQDTWR